MSLIEELEELFQTINLYEIFQIDQNANEEIINRKYKKLSLKYHPDKCKNKELLDYNTKMFQAISKVHKILSNKNQRDYFDKTGEIDELGCNTLFNNGTNTIEEWQEYWRALFPKITIESIIKFENEYKNSEEERKDLLDAYLKYRGNMDLIMDNIMCATIDDEDRFRDILLEEIEIGNIKKFNRFINEPNVRKNKRRSKFLKEENETKKYIKNKDLNMSSLTNMIISRQEKRENVFNSFLDNLMAKYGNEDIDNSDSIDFSNRSSFSGKSVGKKNKKRYRKLSKH